PGAGFGSGRPTGPQLTRPTLLPPIAAPTGGSSAEHSPPELPPLPKTFVPIPAEATIVDRRVLPAALPHASVVDLVRTLQGEGVAVHVRTVPGGARVVTGYLPVRPAPP